MQKSASADFNLARPQPERLGYSKNKMKIAVKYRGVSDSGGFCERAACARRQHLEGALRSRRRGARGGPGLGRGARQSPRHRPRERPPRPSDAPRPHVTRSRSRSACRQRIRSR
ncbi:hypothetical protein RR48_14710 [Papilio machaon]|uniref:Uncharacterized protein n=1 Tax=Papilio machaon TaxID=76193 RepID=A0A194QL16_PAPMA|nr:hypothetical protein RR48_14710 [Papilio machaon]